MVDLNRVQTFKRLKLEKQLIKLLKKRGISRSKVEKLPEEFANRKPEEGVNYYYYIGPNDEKTRPFCKLMLKIDKVFTQEEIEYISEELNYPVLEFGGSYGCRHSWVRFRGRTISTPKPTQREIRKLINNGMEA